MTAIEAMSQRPNCIREARAGLAARSGPALMLYLFVGACATAPPQMIYVPPDMLPESGIARSSQGPALFVGETLVIAPVTGVGTSNLRVLYGALGVAGTGEIWGQTFHEALFKAVQDSGLFGAVARDGTARFVLHADILEQIAASHGATFKVKYSLTDSQSGRSLWKQEIVATYFPPNCPTTSLVPYNSELKALMRACGRNIESLIETLATPSSFALEPTTTGS